MQKLSVNAKRAVDKYGKSVCVQAYALFSENARAIRGVGYDLDLTLAQANAAINAGRELKAIDNSELCEGLERASPVIVDKMVSATGRTLEPGTYTAGVSKVEQVCGRIERTIDIDSARQLVPSSYVPGESATDYAHGHPSFVGRDVKIEFAHGPADADPRTLDFSPLFEISGTLEIISHDSSVPCADGAVSHGMLCRWLPLAPPGKTKGHRPRTYNKVSLGLDTWKVIASKHRFYVHSYEAALRQDGRVCRIEGELWEYEGKRRTPHRDRKVAKLRKILRTLKRGLYE